MGAVDLSKHCIFCDHSCVRKNEVMACAVGEVEMPARIQRSDIGACGPLGAKFIKKVREEGGTVK
jgi:hypothetical protein